MLCNLGDNEGENGGVKWVATKGCISISNLYVRGVETLRGVTFFNTVIHKNKKTKKNKAGLVSPWLWPSSRDFTQFTRWHHSVCFLESRFPVLYIFYFFLLLAFNEEKWGRDHFSEKSFLIRIWRYLKSKRNNKTLGLTKMGISSPLLLKE